MRAALVVLLLAASVGAATDPADNPDIFGVWWRGGPDAAAVKQQAPFVKGVFVASEASRVQPRP